MQPLAYNFNYVKHLLTITGSRSSRLVKPQASALASKYIWRNKALDGYKIADDGVEDKPLDLSNYLLLRTREQMLLQNRVSGALTNTQAIGNTLFGLQSKYY